MKRYLTTYFSIPLYILISVACIIGLIYLKIPKEFAVDMKFLGYLMYSILIILLICFIMLLVTTFIDGAFYYEKFEVPKEDFKIDIYDNLHVWSYKNAAWIYIYGRDKKLKRKSVKMIQYYGRKRQKLHWKMIDDPAIIKNEHGV